MPEDSSSTLTRFFFHETYGVTACRLRKWDEKAEYITWTAADTYVYVSMDIGGVGLLVYSSFNDRPGQVAGNEFAKVREYIM